MRWRPAAMIAALIGLVPTSVGAHAAVSTEALASSASSPLPSSASSPLPSLPPLPSSSSTPSPSGRPSPSLSPSAIPSQSPAVRGSVTMHCPGVGDGTFAAVGHEQRLLDATSTAPHALTALPTVGGPGAILLSDGALEPGFDRWLALGGLAQPQACDVDVTIAPGMPHDRYAITSALPRTIVHDDRGGNTVRFLEIIYTEIARLGF